MVSWHRVPPVQTILERLRRLAVTDPKDLLLVNEQLRRSNRRWKTLALAACAVLVLMAVGIFVVGSMAGIQAERQRRVAEEARVRAEVAAAALRAANPANPVPSR
jgi:hypothetical protein